MSITKDKAKEALQTLKEVCILCLLHFIFRIYSEFVYDLHGIRNLTAIFTTFLFMRSYWMMN